MNLILDIGNTLQKLAVFRNKQLVLKETFHDLDGERLSTFITRHGPFRSAILSSVTNHPAILEKVLHDTSRLTVFTPETPVPLKNMYLTPETLGNDRLAAAVGALSLFPGRNVLSIDAGSCITFDMVTDNAEYLGGAISPGIRMRFEALHTFTGKLPLIEPADFHGLVGRSTRDSILSGVINGITEEIRGVIALYQQRYNALAILITGGDHELLHNNLKINIFAAPNLVLTGLNEILDYNDQPG